MWTVWDVTHCHCLPPPIYVAPSCSFPSPPRPHTHKPLPPTHTLPSPSTLPCSVVEGPAKAGLPGTLLTLLRPAQGGIMWRTAKVGGKGACHVHW